MFTAIAAADTSGRMLKMKQSEILQWILNHKVQYNNHRDLGEIVHRTKKWCERQFAKRVKSSSGVSNCIDRAAKFEQMDIFRILIRSFGSEADPRRDHDGREILRRSA